MLQVGFPNFCSPTVLFQLTRSFHSFLCLAHVLWLLLIVIGLPATTLPTVFVANQHVVAVWSTGKLADLDNAMKGVMLVCADLDRHGDLQPSNASPTSLIEAFLKCMTLTCSLWTEAACYMLLNTRQCMQSPALCLHLRVPSVVYLSVPVCKDYSKE
jgi:hypothetical protein